MYREIDRFDAPSIKAINFDLDTNKLYELTGSKTDGYRQIKDFLEKSGFQHRQWSGYISIEQVTYAEIRALLVRMSTKFDWLATAARQIDATKVEDWGSDLQVEIKARAEAKKRQKAKTEQRKKALSP